jgi:hypothetical protein
MTLGVPGSKFQVPGYIRAKCQKPAAQSLEDMIKWIELKK